MTEKFREATDRGDKFGVLFTDFDLTFTWLWFFTAFDCINHPLLIAEIDSYGVPPMSTKIIFSYFNNRTQRIKIKKPFQQ